MKTILEFIQKQKTKQLNKEYYVIRYNNNGQFVLFERSEVINLFKNTDFEKMSESVFEWTDRKDYNTHLLLTPRKREGEWGFDWQNCSVVNLDLQNKTIEYETRLSNGANMEKNKILGKIELSPGNVDNFRNMRIIYGNLI